MGSQRLLITGGSGFLGSRLAVIAAGMGCRVWATHRRHSVPDAEGITPVRLELTDVTGINSLLRELCPEAVIHTAYSMRDESVNLAGTRELSAACAELDPQPYFLFTSTDLVYDGRRGGYAEQDKPEPISDYGRQKLEAERIVSAALLTTAIVRPSLIYDLARIPLHLGFAVDAIGRGEPFSFFDDEYRCPVLADELAAVILELCARRLGGIWHTAGADRVDRWWFGTRLLAALGYGSELAKRSKSADSPVERPADCSLDSSKVRRELQAGLRGAEEVLGHIELEG